MLTCFNQPIKIKQVYGVDFYYNPVTGCKCDQSYKEAGKCKPETCKNCYLYYRTTYKSIGLIGHNGLDLVPEAGNDYSMYNFFEGKIVIYEHNHVDYGNRIACMQDNGIVEYHNHMEILNPDIKIGQQIKAKTLLGKMGNTGKSLGAHNHYAMANVDKTCFDKNGTLVYRLNYNNGYLGYFNPLPYIGG